MKGGNKSNINDLVKINYEMPASMTGSPYENSYNTLMKQNDSQNAANGQVGGALTCAKAPGVAGQTQGAYANVGCSLQQAYYNQQAQAALDSNVGSVVQSGGSKHKRKNKKKSNKRRKPKKSTRKVKKSRKSRKLRKSRKSRKNRKSRK